MNLSTPKQDLFTPPFLDLKREIYKARQKADAAIYAGEKFITGIEILAEKELPFLIEKHNKLVDELNILINISQLKIEQGEYNSGQRYNY